MPFFSSQPLLSLTVGALLALMVGAPVSAAPVTLSLQSGFADATLLESAPEANAGGLPTLEVGAASPAHRERALLHPDLGAARAAKVVGARLKVWFEGGDGRGVTMQLARVPGADALWNAGAGDGHAEQTGAVSWAYRSFDPSRFEPGNARAGQARHLPWASGAGLDGAREVIASAPLPTAPGWVTFALPAASLIEDAGSGFLLESRDAEAGGVVARFASSETPGAAHRPTLELDVEGAPVQTPNGITYSLPRAARVSLHISNATGEVVKELTFAAPREAGAHSEAWDGGRDALNKTDTDLALPDGQYTAKLLVGPGLSAEYLLALGTTTPSYEPWPGNHLTAIGIAADASGVYVAGGVNEAPSVIIKMTPDGKRLWSAPEYWYQDWTGGHALASDGDSLFFLQQNGKVQVLHTHAATRRGEQKTFDAGFSEADDKWGDRERAGERQCRMDMAARAGHLLVSSEISGAARWLDPQSGKVLAQVAIPDAYGVAVDAAGRGYVLSGDSLLRFEPNGTTPTTLIGPDKLTSPFRVSINPTNGDIYIAETSRQVKVHPGWTEGADAVERAPASEQTKRFSSEGKLLQTYGRRGGRPALGRYDGSIGFRGVTNIAAAPDGSFWITEAYNAPRRTAHFGKDGRLLGEWFGGMQYANHAAPEGDDPSVVWMDCNEETLIRARVDYVHKTWRPLGVYRFRSPLVGAHYHEGGRWMTRTHGGRIYLVRETGPCVLLWDEKRDRLQPASVAGCAHLPWAAKDAGWTLPENLRPTDGSTPSMFSWWDRNGDGQVGRDEITFSPTFVWDMEGGSSTNCAIGADFSYTGSLHPDADQAARAGPGTLTPQWHTVGGGVAVPVYDWGQLAHLFQTLPAHFDAWGDRGALRDDAGNTFSFYNIHRRGGIFSSPLAFGEGAGKDAGGNRLVKWDKMGRRVWDVGRHAATSLPAPGEMLVFQRALGVAHGCAIGSDIRNYASAWNGDGLYVGRLLESAWGETAKLPPTVLHLVEEQFGGMVFEVEDNKTPGLHAGDVLFFAASDNSTPVFRVHGFENLTESRAQLTLKAGRIIAQSPFVPTSP